MAAMDTDDAPFGGLDDFDLEAYRQRNIDMHRAVRQEEASPVGRGRWVRLTGLQAAALNGKIAEIVSEANAEGRLGLRVEGEGDKLKLIKAVHFEPIPDAETVKVCRLSASGEPNFPGSFIQTLRWPVALLESASYPWCECPISSRLGFPLRVTKVKARSKLKGRAAFDNQWLTSMMIDCATGVAPKEWQSHVGPVVVWRPDGAAAVSADDVTLLNEFLSHLLDEFADGNVSPDRDITPESWAKHRVIFIEERKRNVQEDVYRMMVDYEDLNI